MSHCVTLHDEWVAQFEVLRPHLNIFMNWKVFIFTVIDGIEKSGIRENQHDYAVVLSLFIFVHFVLNFVHFFFSTLYKLFNYLGALSRLCAKVNGSILSIHPCVIIIHLKIFAVYQDSYQAFQFTIVAFFLCSDI